MRKRKKTIVLESAKERGTIKWGDDKEGRRGTGERKLSNKKEEMDTPVCEFSD